MSVEFARRSYGHAARGLGEQSLGFREQLDALYQLGIGNVLRPATAFGDDFNRVVAIRRIPNGKRTRDGRGFLRLDIGVASFHRG